MAQTTDGYDILIKWHNQDRSVQGDTTAGCDPTHQHLEMSVEDGEIDADGNEQALMFMSDTSELQSLGGGIFGTESLTDGVAAAVGEQRSNELLSSETPFESSAEPSVSGTAEQNGPTADTAKPSCNATADSNGKQDNPHPLGSSQNPIRIVQQGNKYTSLQELTPEQLNQIMQVHCLILHSSAAACKLAAVWLSSNALPMLIEDCKYKSD